MPELGMITVNDVNNIQEYSGKSKVMLVGMRDAVTQMDQHSRANNVVVYGIPATQGEEVHGILRELRTWVSNIMTTLFP